MFTAHVLQVSSLIFALNHMNARAFAHLYLLGYLWCRIYIRTGNILGPILIHMM
jgi:membrane protease YdiL (CAAX protease family)